MHLAHIPMMMDNYQEPSQVRHSRDHGQRVPIMLLPMMPENVNLYSLMIVHLLQDTGDMDLPMNGDHPHNGQGHGADLKNPNFIFALSYP